MKKCIAIIGIFIIVLSLFSACGDRPTVYRYDKNTPVMGVKINKTEAYEDKLVVTFEEFSYSDIRSVECYGPDFSLLEDDPAFSFKNNVLTIETAYAQRISGLIMTDGDMFLDIYIRYLDSNSYVMLGGYYPIDGTYTIVGNEDAYYTQEEKNQQKKKEAQLEEAEALAFRKVEGEWINERGDMRIVFGIDPAGERYFAVYTLTGNEWVESEDVSFYFISEEDTDEGFEFTVLDSPGFGCNYWFLLSKDGSRLQYKYSYPDEIFVRPDTQSGNAS